jgi:hypothetical protein
LLVAHENMTLDTVAALDIVAFGFVFLGLLLVNEISFSGFTVIHNPTHVSMSD